MKLHLKIVNAKNVSNVQKREVQDLQSICFPHVSEEEAEEDFIHPESAHGMAYIGKTLVGWTGIHLAQAQFEGQQITIGGFGICTHPNYRRKGIAYQLSQASLEYLKSVNCDLGFLSVDLDDNTSIHLHQKSGFSLMKQKFSWKNSAGKVKSDHGGMICPLASQEIFQAVYDSTTPLHIGQGYW